MGLNNFSSDYGSGSSMNSSTSWGSQELDWQTFQSQLTNTNTSRAKAASYADLVSGRCTIEDVMQEFRMNGSDSPYNPDDDLIWAQKTGIPSLPAVYARQKSWPAPERTPAPRLPRPVSVSIPLAPAPVSHALNEVTAYSQPMEDQRVLTEEQRRVLSSLSDAAVLTLLREMRRRNKRQPEECRFCKNNGERESYYRSHALKDARGLVACPVLRAFVCPRCGATGDHAHTIKYCQLSTNEERMKSAAMMRSVRMASGRRRIASVTPSFYGSENYVYFGETPASVIQDTRAFAVNGERAPLDPLWAALEQKLML